MMNASSAAANIVLVHGGFADGSGWRAVYDLLRQGGYRVAVVQNPTLSLAGDPAAARGLHHAPSGPRRAGRPPSPRRRPPPPGNIPELGAPRSPSSPPP